MAVQPTPKGADSAGAPRCFHADAVLALLLLGLHEGDRAWKSFDWDAMNRLYAQGMISNPASKAKSVVFTAEGKNKAQALLQSLFGEFG